MLVDNYMISDGTQDYYSQDFRNVLEDHMTYLINHPNTKRLPVDPMLLYRYQFDFFSVLRNLNIGVQYHWLIMRMNGMTSPTDLNTTEMMIYIPDITIVEKIRSSFVSTQRIKN